MVWVDRELKDHLIPTHLPWAGTATIKPGCSEPHPIWSWAFRDGAFIVINQYPLHLKHILEKKNPLKTSIPASLLEFVSFCCFFLFSSSVEVWWVVIFSLSNCIISNIQDLCGIHCESQNCGCTLWHCLLMSRRGRMWENTKLLIMGKKTRLFQKEKLLNNKTSFKQ